MIERIIGADFENLCSNTSSLSDLLGVKPTPEFVQWQEGLCALDWEQILTEMDESNNVWKDFITQVRYCNTPGTVKCLRAIYDSPMHSSVCICRLAYT